MPGRLLLIAGGLLLPAIALAALKDPPVNDKHWTTKYDGLFRKHAKHYFGPGFDWQWFKAQAIAESNLKPSARSRTGAVGIMQILPSTFREIQKKNPHFVDITKPKWNIPAGIYYDRQMYKRWGDKGFSRQEQLAFAFGSYNAGFGGMRKAYRKATASTQEEEEITRWTQVSPFAPRETRRYVKRIKGLMAK